MSAVVGNGAASPAEVEAAYNSQVAQVTPAEKSAGTQVAVRRFSPKDVADMAASHGGGGTGSAYYKAAVRAVADADVNVAAPGTAFDGVTFTNVGVDRVLLSAQTAPAENGPWVWNGGASPLTRPTDFAVSADAKAGSIITAGPEGASLANTIWMLATADPITLETTGLTFIDVLGQILVDALAADKFSLGVEKTGAAESLAISDAKTIVRMNSALAQTLTVTAGMALWPVGEAAHILNAGAGLVTLAADAGVTLRIPVATSPSQNSSAFLIKLADNDFVAIWLGPSSLPATVLKSDTTANLTAGFTTDSAAGGTVTTGAYDPTPGTGKENIQDYINGGAHTLAAPTSPCTVVVEITNAAAAGAITTSGFTAVDGDAFDLTLNSRFLCYITKTTNVSYLSVKKVQ